MFNLVITKTTGFGYAYDDPKQFNTDIDSYVFNTRKEACNALVAKYTYILSEFDEADSDYAIDHGFIILDIDRAFFKIISPYDDILWTAKIIEVKLSND